jgi:uncharacterized protein (DUF2249 family)
MIRIDARGLPHPQPFERVMESLADLEPGEQILLVLEREPFPLYRTLERNGYRWDTTFFEEDGRYEILIQQGAP